MLSNCSNTPQKTTLFALVSFNLIARKHMAKGNNSDKGGKNRERMNGSILMTDRHNMKLGGRRAVKDTELYIHFQKIKSNVHAVV